MLAWFFRSAAAGSHSVGIPTVRSFSMNAYGGQFGTSVPKYSSNPRVIGPPPIGFA